MMVAGNRLKMKYSYRIEMCWLVLIALRFSFIEITHMQHKCRTKRPLRGKNVSFISYEEKKVLKMSPTHNFMYIFYSDTNFLEHFANALSFFHSKISFKPRVETPFILNFIACFLLKLSALSLNHFRFPTAGDWIFFN